MIKLSRILFENIAEDEGKEILLLVHPDIIFEVASAKHNGKLINLQSAINYIEEFKRMYLNFDFIVVHLFYSNLVGKENVFNWDKELHDLYLDFIKLLKEKSNVVLVDKNFSASFQDELPSYLIDNPYSTIYLAGGYENLCVRATQDMLFRKLEDIIKEQNISISCFPELMIKNRQDSWSSLIDS